jgi:hypothetical protein
MGDVSDITTSLRENDKFLRSMTSDPGSPPIEAMRAAARVEWGKVRAFLPILLGSLFLWPSLVPAQPHPGRDSLTDGTVIIHHGSILSLKLGRKLDGRGIQPGSGRWNGFEMFWENSRRSGDSTVFSRLPPGRYSVWALDSAYRQVYVSFDLGGKDRRSVDARAGGAFTGKIARAIVQDKASQAPVPGASVYYKCKASEPPGNQGLSLHEGAVITDALGRFETPPCLNDRDTLYVRFLVTPSSERTARVKMKRAMERDSLWEIGVIRLDGKERPVYTQERKLLTFSALTYSLGFPLSEGGLEHAFSNSLYFRFYGLDYGFEVPAGMVFVNLKAFTLFAPMMHGNWTIPLGYLGAGAGLYRTLDEDIGYQVQAWYNLLFAHVNVKVRKDFHGPYRSTVGLGISIPVCMPGR